MLRRQGPLRADTLGYACAPVNSRGADPNEPERVTLAHDYLLVMRGAERTFAAIAELYPRAPIFTLLYDECATDGRFAGHSRPHKSSRNPIAPRIPVPSSERMGTPQLKCL